MVSLTSRSFLPQGKRPRYPFHGRLGRPLSRFVRSGEKYLASTGNRTPEKHTFYVMRKVLRVYRQLRRWKGGNLRGRAPAFFPIGVDFRNCLFADQQWLSEHTQRLLSYCRQQKKLPNEFINKRKFVNIKALKAYEEFELQLRSYLTPVVDEVSASGPDRFIPLEYNFRYAVNTYEAG